MYEVANFYSMTQQFIIPDPQMISLIVFNALSAKNHDMMPSLSDIFVYEAGCSTYDLPRDTAETIGYGATAAHPQEATHYMGLYFMASRGARLVEHVSV